MKTQSILIAGLAIGSIFTGVLALSTPAFAVPFVITDPYQGNNAGGSGAGSDDTIGEYRKFDIEKITFTQVNAAKVKADIAVNYNNGNTTLSNFSVGQELGIGDLMFDVGGLYTYGVVLNGHTGTDARLNDGLAVGFYALTGGSNGANTQDSTYYLTPTSIGNYRENNPVRVNSANATLLGAATVTTTLIANAEVNIHVEFVPTLTFLTAFNTSGLSVHFAAATCANDVIDGNIKGTVPEPASLLMLGTGLVGLAAYRRRQTA